MKRIILKRPERILLPVIAAILVFGFQNCSNQMSFDSAGNSEPGKVGSAVDPDTVEGDPVSNPQDPAALVPPGDTDEDTDIDYDHDGKRVAFSCTTGANLKFDEAELLNAKDLTLKNSWRVLFHYSRPLRYVDVKNLRGSIAIKNALRIDQFKNISGLVSYGRAVMVTSVENIRAGISSTAGLTVREIRNVHAGYICASGSQIGTISDLHGLFMKFRGRPALNASPNANGRAAEISNIHSGFSSIYKLDVASIRNVHGELIIRNSTIDSLENLNGGLTLINSTVKNLKNSRGKLRTLNSTVESESNVSMQVIRLIRN